MTNRHFDFDQFMAEKEHKPVTLKAFGKKYELPHSLPALLIVKTLKMQKRGQESTSEEDVIEMAESIFGKKNLDEFLKKGLTMDGLDALIENVIGLYTGGAIEDKTPRTEKR